MYMSVHIITKWVLSEIPVVNFSLSWINRVQNVYLFLPTEQKKEIHFCFKLKKKTTLRLV